MALFAIAFLAGILTVLSPCVLPLLPVIVGGSLAGGTRFARAITVTLALGLSVFLFTFLLKVSTIFINVPPEAWNWVSGAILFIVGIFFLVPSLWDLLPGTAGANRKSNELMSAGFMRQRFWGDVTVGAALGPVFSTCSPTYFIVLATVFPVSLALGTLDIVSYLVGLCLTLLLITFLGQRLIDRLHFASDTQGWFRRIIGILFILIALLIVSNQMAAVETPLYNVFDETKIEAYFLGTTNAPAPLAPQLENATSTPESAQARIAQEALVYPKAPEITDPSGYLNTGGEPITIAGEKGKVVLVDFWDYSCINCEREIPYVEAWWQKYQNEGLVVIGVHTPEFAFEQKLSNVAAAVQSLGITYPVVLDNQYATWNAFGNEYWPQIYLIDSDGFIVYSHSGEGDYAETEAAIQAALKQRDEIEDASTTVSSGTVAPANAVEVNDLELGSPETYFGAQRNEYLANGAQGTQGPQTLTVPASLQENGLYLGGSWDFLPEYAETSSGTVEYEFTAKNVYMVATGNPSAAVEVLLDGKSAGANAGSDVSANGTVTIDQDRLYHLISLPGYGTHTLELKVASGTLDAYTFTFG